MTTVAEWFRLDTSRVFPRVEIVSQFVKYCLSNLNTLYQALWDTYHPYISDASQKWAGHDHQLEGGAPLIRNCQMTADGYTSPIRTENGMTLDTVRAISLMPFYISPELATPDLSRQQEVAIFAKATGGEMEVRCGVGAWVKIPVGTAPDWFFLKRPITRDATWEDFYLHVKPVSGQGWQFDLYAVQVVETYEESQPDLGQRGVRFDVAAHTIYSYYEALCDELGDANQWLDSDILKRIFSAANLIFEGITDLRLARAGQVIKGHDHLPVSGSGYGGRPVGMGKVFSVYKGGESFGDGLQWLITLTGATSTWVYADLGLTARRTTGGSSPGGVPSTDPIFKCWCTDGLSSAASPPTTYPRMDGWIKISWDNAFPAATVYARLYNQTAAAFSDTVQVYTDTWIYVSNIPMVGGSWNDFDVQVMSSDTENLVIETHGLIIAESFKTSGNLQSYVDSAGKRILGAKRSGREVAKST